MDKLFKQMYAEKPIISKETMACWCENNEGMMDASNEDDTLFKSKVESLKLTKKLVSGYIRTNIQGMGDDFERITYNNYNGDMARVAQSMLHDIAHELFYQYCKGFCYVYADEDLIFD